MKTVVAVEDFDAMRKRSLDRASRLDKGEHVESERRITFETPEDMGLFLNSRRLSVLRAAMKRPQSVSELAVTLKRNRPAVSRDVRLLRQAGLVQLNREPNPGHGQKQVVQAAAREFEFRYRLSA